MLSSVEKKFPKGPPFIEYLPQSLHQASIIAAVIMLVVLYIGAVVLHFFGISIGALRLAGGLIVAYIGFRILFPSATPTPGARYFGPLAPITGLAAITEAQDTLAYWSGCPSCCCSNNRIR